MDPVWSVMQVIDPVFISFYRMTDDAMLNFLLGTFILAMLAVVIGEFTLSLTLRFNRRHIEAMEQQLSRQHNLSMAALEMDDKAAYNACNKQANDAFGKYFFTMIASSAACLWPAAFALAWMQGRFDGVQLKLAYPVSLLWSSTGYFCVFVLLYVLARILFKHTRRFLPYFRHVQKSLDLHAAAHHRPTEH